MDTSNGSESLSEFFRELGIDHFITGSEIGEYGVDWKHLRLDELDRIVQQKRGYSHGLQHTTELPHTVKKMDPLVNATMYATLFGKIEQPYIMNLDGIRYTFIAATFRGGRFFVKTKIKLPNRNPFEGAYTLEELRGMIGPFAPPFQVPPKGLMARAISWFQ